MRVFIKPTFFKDYEDLPKDIRAEVRQICFKIFPDINSLKDLTGFQIKPIKSYKGYYRIKLGNYRIGLKKENGSVVFMRVKHRKDIYKLFP